MRDVLTDKNRCDKHLESLMTPEGFFHKPFRDFYTNIVQHGLDNSMLALRFIFGILLSLSKNKSIYPSDVMSISASGALNHTLRLSISR